MSTDFILFCSVVVLDSGFIAGAFWWLFRGKKKG